MKNWILLAFFTLFVFSCATESGKKQKHVEELVQKLEKARKDKKKKEDGEYIKVPRP